MEIHLPNPIVVVLHPRESNVDFTNDFRLLSMNLLAHELCNLVKTNCINSLCFSFNESSRVWQNLPDLRNAMTFPQSWQTISSVQCSSVAQSCRTVCDPMNRSTPGLPGRHQLPEFTQIHVHRVGDAIQPSHPLSSPFPAAPNPSQHQSLFQWVNSSHQVARVLEFQPQHQSFQRTPRTDLL